MSVYIGIDIGGTKMMAAAFDAAGRVLGRVKEATPQDPDVAIGLMNEMVASVAGQEAVEGIGMAICGPIDMDAGTASPVNLKQWRDMPLRAALEKRWGCSFHFGVDTDVAAVAEYALAGLEVERFLYLTVSTGLGGGFLLGGKVYRGMRGIHPEVGHQAIPARLSHPERVLCGCGNRDCLEAIVSGSGIERIYQKSARDLDKSEWDEVAYNLSLGLRNMIMLLSPDLIVLGGGVATGGGHFFIEQTRAYLDRTLTLAHMPEIRVSQLGYDTALLGAGYIAQHPESLT